MGGLQCLKPLIEDPNYQKTLQKPLYYHQDFLCASNQQLFQNLIHLIVNNNLGDFSKDSSYEPKRCQITFYFATYTMSYEILYL